MKKASANGKVNKKLFEIKRFMSSILFSSTRRLATSPGKNISSEAAREESLRSVDGPFVRTTSHGFAAENTDG